jgi:glucose-1-phosphatase
MAPKFLYFDLGKVLVDYSVERMLDQMAAVAGVSAQTVDETLFGRGLMRQHETGLLSKRQLYEAFCQATGTRPDFAKLAAAAADIFELNVSMVPLVAQLCQAGYRMGILSNTCDTHWDHCLARYRIVRDSFSVFALSHRIGALKPDAAIYRAAADLAGCSPREIFFVDDLPGHVAGARAVGFDAVQFTGPAALADELRQRGLRFNY